MGTTTLLKRAFLRSAWVYAQKNARTLQEQLLFEQVNLVGLFKSGLLQSVQKNSASQAYSDKLSQSDIAELLEELLTACERAAATHSISEDPALLTQVLFDLEPCTEATIDMTCLRTGYA